MKIIDWEVFPLNLPFRFQFRHAGAVRKTGESVIVTVRATEGRTVLTGTGEGAPRAYVTKETQQGALSAIQSVLPVMQKGVTHPGSLRRWIRENRSWIDQNPAAFAAVERALLELFAKQRNCSILELLDGTGRDFPIRKTVVLPDTAYPALYGASVLFRLIGCDDFKIKLSGERMRDLRKISFFRKRSRLRFRLDANNFWSDPDDVNDFCEELPVLPEGIEEPLRPFDYSGMRRLKTDFPVILDESFVKLDDFRFIERDPRRWIINYRISKMGGLIRSLEIFKKAQRLGIAGFLGAHVGESSVLTDSGRIFWNLTGGELRGMEGLFNGLLLRSDPFVSKATSLAGTLAERLQGGEG